MPDFAPIYSNAGQNAAAIVFPFIGEKLLLAADAALPDAEVLRQLGAAGQRINFGLLDGSLCEMQVWPADCALPAGLRNGEYRELSELWPHSRLAALSRAQQLATWLQQNRFCGRCGQQMQLLPAEPACRCPDCAYLAYPRISPVCMGLVLKDGQMLLARSPHFPPGVYSALAGYLEAGESAEDCLRREIREEAGIEIANIRWFGSQSWPYPHSLMLGFIADYAGGDLVPQESEIEALGWYDYDDLPGMPHPASLAYAMIEAVRRHRISGGG